MHLTMIYTKFLPATDTRGARIKATTANGKHTATVPYDHELTGIDVHKPAADAVIGKVVAANRYATGYVWVASGDAPGDKGHAFAYRLTF